MLKLQFVDGSRESIWLVDSVLKIGSQTGNNLVISAPDMKPFHAEILLENDELTLRNLGTDTTVGINGKPIGKPQKLKVNDIINLGQTRLKIVTPASEPKGKTAAKAVPEGEWALEINASWARQSRFPIRDNAIIGRDEGCDICVPVNHLSRQHARLTPAGSFLLIKDLDSTNGTFLNGEKIVQGRAKPGDKLRFDVVTFDVVGPVTDANKTLVRAAAPQAAGSDAATAGAGKPATPVVKASQARATTPTVSRPAKAVPRAKTEAPPATQSPSATAQGAPARRGMAGPVWLFIGVGIVLAIVAGAILFTK